MMTVIRGWKAMTREEAYMILDCYLSCPCRFGDGKCIFGSDDDEFCYNGCWSRLQVEGALRFVLGKTCDTCRHQCDVSCDTRDILGCYTCRYPDVVCCNCTYYDKWESK